MRVHVKDSREVPVGAERVVNGSLFSQKVLLVLTPRTLSLTNMQMLLTFLQPSGLSVCDITGAGGGCLGA